MTDITQEKLLTPLETKVAYEKSGIEVSPDDLKLLMVSALENQCRFYASKGGTPATIADAVMHLVAECGKPYFMSHIEVRRAAARVFRECLDNNKSYIDKLKGKGKRQNIADDLSLLESWMEYRTEQFHFGIPALDRAIGGGIMKGQTMSIIGNPGSMKTSLLINGIETWVMESDDPVSFISADMNKASVLERLMLRELECGCEVLRDHYRRNSIEYQAAKQRIGKRYKDKLYIYENSIREKWTIDKIIEHVEVNTPGLLCIDFLTQLKKPRQSDFDVVNEAVPILKDLAHSYGCAIVMLSQMSMASRQIQSAGGMGGAAKGGPVVEENVDIELELFRDVSEEQGEKPRIVATVKKTRFGIAGSSYDLDYSGPQMRFKGTATRAYRVRKLKPLFETGTF